MLGGTSAPPADAKSRTSAISGPWIPMGALLFFCLLASPACGQGRLPELCFAVGTDSPLSAVTSKTNESRVVEIADSLRRAIPSSPEGFESPSIWSIRGRLDALAKRDSVLFLWALASLVVDNRTTTTFAAVVAAQYYSAYGGSAEQLLAAFHEAAEPEDRLAWVFLALTPPLSPAAEREVFRHGCVAAWTLSQLNQDPFLKALEAQGRAPFSRLELESTLSDVERLTSGQVREAALLLREAASGGRRQ